MCCLEKHRSSAWRTGYNRHFSLRPITSDRQHDMIQINNLSLHTNALREPLLAAITRVIDSGWFILGPELEAFEREFAAWCGAAHAIGVANGTEAIELALRALGVKAGDEVVVAANAGMYSTTALLAIGATPIFADVDARHLNIDPTAVTTVISPRTKAIIATHLYGRMAQMPELKSLASQHGIALLEDCAQAHGASLDGVRAGAWGDAASFSFYPTKNLGALGDGGLVTCRDSAIAERLRRLRQYGWAKKYVVVDGPARNSRLDEIQAAVLRLKLPLVDGWNTRRREIATRYAAVAHPQLQHPDVTGSDYVAHLYVVRTLQRESLQRHLAQAGIGTDIHYPLLDPQQAVLHDVGSLRRLPVSLAASAAVLSLPCYPELSADAVMQVCAALADWKVG
jgi:aminotransferase EvaB